MDESNIRIVLEDCRYTLNHLLQYPNRIYLSVKMTTELEQRRNQVEEALRTIRK